MALINYAAMEVSCKVVYYGPGLAGKTTNLKFIHKKIPPNKRSKLISFDTSEDRTLFFDFLPMNLGRVGGFNTRFHLYTVPGQVYYEATRKLVLRGVDGVVFVADSLEARLEANLLSLRSLRENLLEQSVAIETLPFVMQYNKRDLPGILPVEILREELNDYYKVPDFEVIAIDGIGVIETLRKIAKLVTKSLS